MKIKILTALLFVSFLTNAQIVFEKGYFINNNGKTTNCYIKNVDWRSNPASFNYKMDLQDKDAKTETIATVSEFSIDNISRYKRYTVNIEYSANDVNSLTESKNPVWVTETHFLKELVNGEANLYAYDKDNFSKFFYETKSRPIEQLVRIKYMNGTYIQENNLFRQQLNNNVKCEKTPENSFKSIEYTKNDLVKHFLKFNSCTETPVRNLSNETERAKYSLRVTGGVYAAKMTITDSNIFYNVGTDVSKTIFKFGLDAEYILPFYKNTLSIFTAPTYQKFSAQKSYEKNDGNINGGATIYNTVNIDYASVEIPLGIRYYFFQKNNSKIYFNAAFILDIPTSKSLEFSNTNRAINATHSLKFSPRNNLFGGIGYDYKRYSAELRFYTNKELLGEETVWSAKYSNIGLNIGYKIF